MECNGVHVSVPVSVSLWLSLSASEPCHHPAPGGEAEGKLTRHLVQLSQEFRG